MKTTMFTTAQPPTKSSDPKVAPRDLTGDLTKALTLNLTYPLPISPNSDKTVPGERVKHILLGSPSAIRQTIHLLHSLRYAETVLWSPVLRVEEPLAITPEQGEAMSLLRRML